MRSFEEYQDIAGVFMRAGFTDQKSYPEIRAACESWHQFGDPSDLEMVIEFDPGLVDEARRRAAALEEFEEMSPFRPYPDRDEAKRVSGQYRYGFLNFDKDELGFTTDDFPLGICVWGAQGTGKSYGIFWVLDQILSTPPDVRGFNVVIIQRVKREADPFAVKYPWLKVLEWTDLRYNMWEVWDWDCIEDKLRASTKIFASENFLYAWSVPPLQYAVLKAYRDFGVYDGSKRFPLYKTIRESLAEYKKAFGFDGYDMKNTFDRLKNRLIEFEMEDEVLNVHRGLPFRFFLENDLCINVVDQSEFIIRTILMSLFYDIQRYYAKRPLPGGGTRILVVLDEARWLFDVSRDRTEHISNEIVEKWFTTCRESGFGRIILTQEPQSISSFVTNNCAIRIGFPVYGEGLERAQLIQNLSDDQRDYVGGLPRPGVCVVRHPGLDRPFLVEVPRW